MQSLSNPNPQTLNSKFEIAVLQLEAVDDTIRSFRERALDITNLMSYVSLVLLLPGSNMITASVCELNCSLSLNSHS